MEARGILAKISTVASWTGFTLMIARRSQVKRSGETRDQRELDELCVCGNMKGAGG